MKYKMNTLLASLLLTAALVSAQDTPSNSLETSPEIDARMARWREAKFGMFIHWGLYAIPARGEWVMINEKFPVADYKAFASQFNPVKFNAEEWVKVAELQDALRKDEVDLTMGGRYRKMSAKIERLSDLVEAYDQFDAEALRDQKQ